MSEFLVPGTSNSSPVNTEPVKVPQEAQSSSKGVVSVERATIAGREVNVLSVIDSSAEGGRFQLEIEEMQTVMDSKNSSKLNFYLTRSPIHRAPVIVAVFGDGQETVNVDGELAASLLRYGHEYVKRNPQAVTSLIALADNIDVDLGAILSGFSAIFKYNVPQVNQNKSFVLFPKVESKVKFDVIERKSRVKTLFELFQKTQHISGSAAASISRAISEIEASYPASLEKMRKALGQPGKQEP